MAHSSAAADQNMVRSCDVVVVGAGVGGLYTLFRLRQLGFTVQVLEQGGDVGGTWYWNKYPGCRCDVESYQYSYSFSEELQREWTWSERFAPQPEILSYLQHVADRFDLRRDIAFNTTVSAANWDEARQEWKIETEDGNTWVAPYCIMATGSLSVPRTSVLPSQDAFAGEIYYTATWPADGVDVTGKRVGIVGTSASGTQSIPHLAAQASHLTVFQRTANFSIPSRNAPMNPATDAEWKANYTQLRKEQWQQRAAIIFETPTRSALEVDAEELERELERRWEAGGLGFLRAFTDLFSDHEANGLAADFVRRKIGETVRNPEVAGKLMPTDHPIGSRRICTDNGYYETFNRDNVTLVDVRSTPIEEVLPGGVRTSDAVYPLDVLVLATGFDAVIGALCRIDIRGRDGALLRDKWVNGPVAHMGLAVAGYPNLFYQTGPLSTGTLASMIQGNELQTDWLATLLVHARENGITEIEATEEAAIDWTIKCDELAKSLVHYYAPESSYIFKAPDGSRKFMIYTGGFDGYRQELEACAKAGYSGFVMQKGVHAGISAAAQAVGA
ncbi:NAD(P)/FAD-dependent oxidoreductase [Sphingobium sp. V4]|uniref:flavin-containing monooxygenase n=1 Tax=Sphingobium sp. V4 TaxID=3038927 RepID=UPI002557D9ED|nr:NAD(P)/FAD-dependent oxidoreductase [Sphingobium sp. V4]WIW89423.1 NAD(P)/FAD-dependent oxidoreductase [Sphingobium sp. V4]